MAGNSMGRFDLNVSAKEFEVGGGRLLTAATKLVLPNDEPAEDVRPSGESLQPVAGN
ncbi:MAG: hypothetical protein ACJ741_05230 [Pyrinomonadaceae bacterium]